MNVLVVAAHPDDEVLGCGGTTARLAQEGAAVVISILAEGLTSRYQQRDQADRSALDKLHADAREVARMLGAREVLLHGLPDNRLDTVPLLDVVKVVEELVKKYSPERIYTHHVGDLNVDHGIVQRAVLTATRPMKGQKVRDIFSFEVPSSTEWAFQQFEPVFRPNVFVDISKTLPLKIEAIEKYESEARSFPHPRSRQALEAIARRWGSVVGLEAAEAFQLVRSVS